MTDWRSSSTPRFCHLFHSSRGANFWASGDVQGTGRTPTLAVNSMGGALLIFSIRLILTVIVSPRFDLAPATRQTQQNPVSKNCSRRPGRRPCGALGLAFVHVRAVDVCRVADVCVARESLLHFRRGACPQ